jgi:mono/diheme cytochrome c family protein
MSQEIRALAAGLIAALLALPTVFGLSTLARGQRSVAPSPERAGSSVKSGAGQGDLAAGRRLFAGYCASCHGADAEGGIGPSLRSPTFADGQIASAVTRGVPGAMPAFGGKLDGAQVQAIVAYLHSLRR